MSKADYDALLEEYELHKQCAKDTETEHAGAIRALQRQLTEAEESRKQLETTTKAGQTQLLRELGETQVAMQSASSKCRDLEALCADLRVQVRQAAVDSERSDRLVRELTETTRRQADEVDRLTDANILLMSEKDEMKQEYTSLKRDIDESRKQLQAAQDTPQPTRHLPPTLDEGKLLLDSLLEMEVSILNVLEKCTASVPLSGSTR